MKRSKHNLSHYKLMSCDMGQLVPVGALEVLPGDTFQHDTTALIRVSPQLKPVMHPVYVHIAHYFVPNRLVWSGWEDFITGESATPPPTVLGQVHALNKVSDCIGIKNNTQNEYSALPLRAYNKIWNEYYRDQDLDSEIWEDNNNILNVRWQKDYFTAARPWPQKGDAVTLPIGTKAPVKGIGVVGQTYDGTDRTVYESGESSSSTFDSTVAAATSGKVYVEQDPDNAGFPGVYADLADADAIDIRDFREAFGMQRYQEARARYGSSYVDYLRYLGIRGSDARLQRPEYLGGGVATLQFSEVLNTNSDGTAALGELGGHGIAMTRSNKYRRFFEEHGWVISVMYVRPKNIYMNGLPRKFTRTTKEDYFQRELQNIGAQEIKNKELTADHSNPDGTFGYAPRYSEYRTEASGVAGEFRDSLNWDWHFGRNLSGDVALNSSFVNCQPTKRVFADQTNHSLWCMINHRVGARRMVGRGEIGSMM